MLDAVGSRQAYMIVGAICVVTMVPLRSCCGRGRR